MKARISTYNIRPDPAFKTWLSGFDSRYYWTSKKEQAHRFSGREAEARLRQVRKQHPNALLEAASQRVDWAKPEIESGFD